MQCNAVRAQPGLIVVSGVELVREQAHPLQEKHRQVSGGGQPVRCQDRPGGRERRYADG